VQSELADPLCINRAIMVSVDVELIAAGFVTPMRDRYDRRRNRCT
jgi:DNA-binding MarR family transcriptional regulator